ncbi:MAG: hypothetical protein AAF533_13630 [Acidobacteriota bacterium]
MRRLTLALLLTLFAVDPTEAQDLVSYVGGPARERFLDALALSDGTLLVAGTAQDLDWIDGAVPRTTLPASGIANANGGGWIGFILHLSGDLQRVLRVVHFPPDAIEDVSVLRTTGVPGQATGDLYFSGTTRDTRGNGGGYVIGRLDGNFVDAPPTDIDWTYNVWAEGHHQSRPPWDVGGDGKVVYTRGQPYDYDWCSVHRLNADGEQEVVENWRWHWVDRDGDGATDGEAAGAPASALPDTAIYSGLIFKAAGRCDLRSWTMEDYEAITPDSNGGTRQGSWPMDYFFAGPCDPDDRDHSTPGYTGYRVNRPTQRIGGIAVDRRSNAIHVGFSVQSILPSGNPDFEPGVVSFDADGSLLWWDRLYRETPANSPPDQYVDGLAIDYSVPESDGTLVVLARCHGNAVDNLWSGNDIAARPDARSFQQRFTGTNGNIHISWLGRFSLRTGTLQASSYVAEYVNGDTVFGGAHDDPNLDGWPDPNRGWPDLNTTRCHQGVEVDGRGRVIITCAGRRTITTANAHQKMLKPGEGNSTWNEFVRIYESDLSTLVYSSILTGEWDPVTQVGGANTTLAATAPTDDGVIVVGHHGEDPDLPDQPKGNPVPTTGALPWGRTGPEGGESALIARLGPAAVPPITDPELRVTRSGDTELSLSWTTGGSEAAGYDLVVGTLAVLRTGGFDHLAASPGAGFPDSSTGSGCDVSGGAELTARVRDLPDGDLYLLVTTVDGMGARHSLGERNDGTSRLALDGRGDDCP